jgi:tetratricopeptide (TPR) repeat protein
MRIDEPMALSMSRWLAFAALLLSFSTAGAEEYWHYRYHGIEVVAAGNEQYAINLAHNMHRLDTAIVTVLPLELGDWRPRTLIFAVPTDEHNKLLDTKSDTMTRFNANGFRNIVVMGNTTSTEAHYWEAYFGYAGSLLVSEGALRYPDWFRQGVSGLFAETVISSDQVTIGGYSRNTVHTLMSQPLMPMHKFLHLRTNDPQLEVKEARFQYDVQCTFLAHLIVIDKLLEQEFSSYLRLVSEGQNEDAAFAASFSMSYEDLDRAVAAALHSGRIRTLAVNVPDEPVKALPVRLSAAAAKGRLALVAIDNEHSRDYGMKLVSEALATDPNDEYALQALAVAQTQREQYGDALATLDKLAANSSLSAAGLGESGELLIAVAGAIRSQKATLPADPAVLAHRAYDDYRRATALEPESLDYWAAFADAYGEERDKLGAKEFLPKIEQVFYLHPRNSMLASHIARMCGEVGDLDDAIKFAVAWKGNATNAEARDAAVAFISRVQAAKERQSLLQPATAAQGTSQ